MPLHVHASVAILARELWLEPKPLAGAGLKATCCFWPQPLACSEDNITFASEAILARELWLEPKALAVTCCFSEDNATCSFWTKLLAGSEDHRIKCMWCLKCRQRGDLTVALSPQPTRKKNRQRHRPVSCPRHAWSSSNVSNT